MEQVHSLCRVCHLLCPLIVETEDGKPVKIYGDKANPLYHGYTCIKGREQLNYLTAESRLRHSVVRRASGEFEPISSETAIAEVADKIKAIIEEHGPRSVALYIGTQAAHNLITRNMATAWMEAIGSPMVFSSLTIDQPGKVIAPALHGIWLAGPYVPEDADVWLLMGTNPFVSMQGGLPINPARGQKLRKQQGKKLIVVDPRRTEVARAADMHLQALPAHDAAILAAMIRVIIREKLYAAAFVDANAQGLEVLERAVAPFDVETVARNAGINADELVAAARLYASAKVGGVSLGTGSNMSGRANLAEYLSLCLMTLCGHWLRAGEPVRNSGVLVRRFDAIAQAFPPFPAWGYGEKLRVRGLANSLAGLPTTGLSDEILLDGPGKVRALISLGGNPMMAWPDQDKTHRALRALDLLVSLDPVVNGTGRYAHYVIAPKVFLETSGNTALFESYGVLGPGWGYQRPYAQACSALVDPPAGSDLIDDWEFFYGVGARLGVKLRFKSAAVVDPRDAITHDLDMALKPSMDALWDMVLDGAPISLRSIDADAPGRLYDIEPQTVRERDAGNESKLMLADVTMMGQLGEIAQDAEDGESAFDFKLVTCRLHDVHNSSWRDVDQLKRRYKFNAASINENTANGLGVASGDVIEIESRHGAVLAIVDVSADVRDGVVALPPCWGATPDEKQDPFAHGASAAKLVAGDDQFDPITGIPLMSGVPVRLRKHHLSIRVQDKVDA